MVSPHAATEPVLTVVITCMGRLHHLRQSLPLVAAQTRVRCLVVDYACPDDSGSWVESRLPMVQVVRRLAKTRFNISKARNLGASQANTPWVCFMDADTLAGPEVFGRILDVLRDRTFFLADPCPDALSGMVVCRLDDFRAIGGYDELFSGWGSEDRDLYTRLERSGCTRAFFQAQAISMIDHGDAERTRYHRIGDHFLSLRLNGLYFQIKTDLARQTNTVELSLEHRQAIRSRISNLVLSNPHSAVQMEVELPWTTDFMQPPGWQLRRSIRYVFEPEKPSHHE